jgi:hypothetical protein
VFSPLIGIIDAHYLLLINRYYKCKICTLLRDKCADSRAHTDDPSVTYASTRANLQNRSALGHNPCRRIDFMDRSPDFIFTVPEQLEWTKEA